MKINSISLKNFRNYSQSKIELSPRINLFLGNNGHGKTSLLEAVWICVNGRSYRTAKSKNVINFSNKSAEIEIRTTNNDSINEIKVQITENKKKFLVNDKKNKNRSELKKILATVLIDREFKENLEKSFRPRRLILDSIMSNISLSFSKKLQLYSEEIKRKNEILRTSKNDDILDFIDVRLLNLSHSLSSERSLWLSRITNIAGKVLRKLAPKNSLDLNIKSDSLDSESLNSALKSNRIKEKITGKCLVGSHKDQISFILNGFDAFEFGSEGEKKSVSMALKISEILLLKKVNNDFPIILVDEIGSEFDQKRFNFFYTFITSLETQCFITANNKSVLDINKSKDFSIFSIINGDCKKIS
ncbi:DNA replication and repair protein RecF [bacterium]|jgi:DNA replication and repair protein RecF|nr:DNA replication and repair protein RecF [bacterium]MBT3795189.1 DNA replication and repair protein RecF [bacterium]MBT4634948.1 DNA replication and repair protein RecF [bacterium]